MKNSMKTILLLQGGAVILLLAGCAAPKVWYKPDGTPAQAFRDLGTCQMDAAKVPVATGNLNGPGAFMAGNIAYGRFVDSCMMSKGYVRVRADSVPNGNAYPH